MLARTTAFASLIIASLGMAHAQDAAPATMPADQMKTDSMDKQDCMTDGQMAADCKDADGMAKGDLAKGDMAKGDMAKGDMAADKMKSDAMEPDGEMKKSN